ncbi:Mog1p/PsbP-like protein [Imleria badia]|nr:Mog1p/PsbP-like protein [Imleria badia]
MVLKHLFGGAIVADLPSVLVDASDFRQVPDNQEVFLYPDSSASIIVEVLQRISEPIDEKAVKFHFEALAHDNDAISSTMQIPFVMRNDPGDQTPSPIILHGSQRIHKFNAIAADDVDIVIALFRVNSGGKSADLVVSANIPRSSDGSVGKERAAAIASEFNSLISSLRIINYDLFC